MVLLAAAPVDQLFVLTGWEDELDRQLLDDLGLSRVEPISLILQMKAKSGSSQRLRVVCSTNPLGLHLLILFIKRALDSLLQQAAEQLSLFTAEEEVFALQRTVSRLEEMQTESYWSDGDRSHSTKL